MEQSLLRKMADKMRSVQDVAEREKMLYAWDEVFSTACCENDPALGAFYNGCTRRAIREIRAYTGKIPRLWKFYSSGVIIKADGVVRAFDLNCGCELETSRTRLRFTSATLRALADLIDEYYVTHAHVDHIGVPLADALLKRRKKVIANRDTIRKWLLTDALEAEKIKLPNGEIFPSFQRIGAQNLPNCAYVVKLAKGCTILIKGDIYTGPDVAGLCDWIEQKKMTIDYAVISIFGMTDPKIIPEVRRRFNSTIIPVHEWEFGHREWGKAGAATQTYADLYRELRLQKCSGIPLMWGESVELTPRKK